MILTASWQPSRRDMARVNLKGIAKVTPKGRTYWYAWRGGPRLRGEPGSPEFIASYREAYETLQAPDTSRFRSLVVLYKASGEYEKLAASTRRNWVPWLDRIGEYFGELQVAQFDRPEKIRPVIRQWRKHWAGKPRTADYGLQVLSRDPLGRIAGNPCEGIKQLYSGDRSQIIWTEADIAQVKSACAPEIACAGLSERVIAEIMGWEEEYVAKTIRRHVGRSAATKAIIAQLNQAKERT